MSSTLSKSLAVVVASLLAIGTLVATPLTANAATDSSVTITVLDPQGNAIVHSTATLNYYVDHSADDAVFGDPMNLPQTSDGSGSFEIPGLSDSVNANVTFAADGYGSNSQTISLSAGDNTASLEAVSISGTVNANGSVLSNATVELYGIDTSTPMETTTTNDGGYYNFPQIVDGDYVVRVVAAGYATAINGNQADDVNQAIPFTIARASQIVDFILGAVPTFTLSGAYSNTHGTTGSVYFERFVGDSYSLAGSSAIDIDGNYGISLTSGYYRIRAYVPGYKIPTRYVTITDQNVSAPNTKAIPAGTAFNVTITAPHQDPSNPVIATVYEQVTAGNWQPVTIARPLESGVLHAVLTVGETYRTIVSDPSGTYRSRALALLYENYADDITNVNQLDSNWDFVGPADFSGYYQTTLSEVGALSFGTFDYYGAPVANATITFYRHTDGFDSVKSTRTDANGNYAAFLPDGDYSVAASADSYTDVGLDANNLATVSPELGQANFGTREFLHATAPTVSGTVTDQWGNPLHDVTATLQLDDGNGGWATYVANSVELSQATDATGTYSFTLPTLSTQQNLRVLVGSTNSAEFLVDPSKLVNPIRVTVDGAAFPADMNIGRSLDAPKVGKQQAVPTVNWTTAGWTTTSVQWFVDDVQMPSDADSDTFTPTLAQLGHALGAIVTGTNGELSYGVSISPVLIEGNSFSESPMYIGTSDEAIRIGDVVSANPQWGTDGVTETWAWTRGETPIGTNSSTYTLTADDLAQTLHVTVHGVKDGFTTADKSGDIEIDKATLDASGLTVTGTKSVGYTLTALLPHIPAGVPVTYNWVARNTNDIVGTGATHKITAADMTNRLRLSAVVASSDTNYATSAALNISTVNLTFTDAAVKVSGTPAVGNVLTSSLSGVSPDIEGLMVTPLWFNDDEDTVSGTTYTVTEGDFGLPVEAYLTVRAPGYNTTSVYLDVQIDGRPATPGTATITGTPAVGSQLVGTVTPWVTPQNPTLTSGWYIDGVSVNSKGATPYLVKAADRGKTIVFRVTGTKSGYSQSTAEASIAIPLDALAPGVPTLDGTSTVGSVLTATTGTWSAGATLTTQWLRSGVDIAGETALTHTVSALDQGTNITFRVTASQPGFATLIIGVTTAIPAADVPPIYIEKIVTVTDTVTVHTFGATPAPKISGKAKVGKTLKAKPTAWRPGAEFTFQWFANGKAISGATKSSLKLAASVKGKKITVTVTGAKSGYQTETATSAATAKVAKK